MSSIKSIRAKKAQLYKAVHELDYWEHDEDNWRYLAIRDYDAAITALRAVMAEYLGYKFANALCRDIDEMVRKRYNFDETDITKAKLMDYDAFIRKV